jgi:hypothetical protein
MKMEIKHQNQILKKKINMIMIIKKTNHKNLLLLLQEVDQMHPDPFIKIHNLVNLQILLIQKVQLDLLNKKK